MYEFDPYFQIWDYDVPVKGITREILAFHISDLHIAHCTENSSQADKDRVHRQKTAWEPIRLDFARRYGDSVSEEHLLDPEEGWTRTVDMLNAAPCDLALFTGDMMEDYSPDNLSFLTDGLKRLSIPWMWVCGNHEKGHTDAYLEWMNGHPDFQTLSVDGLRFIGINNADKQVTSEQLEKLKKAADSGPSVLVMHIPMLTEFNRSETKVFGEYFLMGTGDVLPSTRDFLTYMQSDVNPISAVLCGHVHGRHLSEYRPGKPQICASSCMVGSINRIHFVPDIK
ncbi:MAG: metallophosphoesterase [Clostridia bacterium]|nr:metallophosphoesterase [Clostridia bacterium]